MLNSQGLLNFFFFKYNLKPKNKKKIIKLRNTPWKANKL